MHQLTKEHKYCLEFVKRIPSIKSLRLPKFGSNKFNVYRESLLDKLQGVAWKPHGKFILSYKTTNVANEAIVRTSADLALALVASACAQDDKNVTYSQIVGGAGKSLLRNDLGIKLYHHIVSLYHPTGICATWDSDIAWNSLVHHNQIPIKSLANEITDCAIKLTRSSNGLIPINKFQQKLKLMQLVCFGPYQKAYETVLEKMCISQAAEWDITDPNISYNDLIDMLSQHLKQLQYMGKTGLLTGSLAALLSSNLVSAKAATAYDKWGKTKLDCQECLRYHRFNWLKGEPSKQNCFICQSCTCCATSCPILKEHRFTLTYQPQKDSNPKAYPEKNKGNQHQQGFFSTNKTQTQVN